MITAYLPVGILLVLMLAVIVVSMAAILYLMRKQVRAYDAFQESMKEGDQCCFYKNEKCKRGRINKLYDYNAMVETEGGELVMVGRVDLFPVRDVSLGKIEVDTDSKCRIDADPKLMMGKLPMRVPWEDS